MVSTLAGATIAKTTGAGPNLSQKIGKVICVPVEFAVGQLARPRPKPQIRDSR